MGITTPRTCSFEITFSQCGDRIEEAATWLSTVEHGDFFMIQARSTDPRPTGALAYRGHGFAVRRADVLTVLAELPDAEWVRTLWGFLAVGLE